MPGFLMIKADARRIPLADRSVHCCVTSPPYWRLRDYGVEGQVGLEKTPDEYVAAIVDVFREVWRVLRDDGTLWLNIGDTYAGSWGAQGRQDYTAHNSPISSGQIKAAPRKQTRTGSIDPGSRLKPKDLALIPARLALALQEDGWYLRSEIIWLKAGAMPESVRDRPSRSHEQVYMLSKSRRYFYDTYAIRTPAKTLGRKHDGKSGYREGHPSKGGIKARSLNPMGVPASSVWRISSGGGYKGAHFATMPIELASRCIKLGSSEKGCCPRCGSPWVRIVDRHRVPTRPGVVSKVTNVAKNGLGHRVHHPEVTGNRDPLRHTTAVSMLGWESSCSCLEPSPVPCKIFDPFGGAMTTLVAANALGRGGIASELSEEYLALGKERLERPHVVKPKSTPVEPMPLFGRRNSP